MVEQFIKAKFSANVASKMTYDNDTQFNEGNITLYLSELEEYISNLITILAYKRGDPHPAISSVPLERLTLKEFAQKDLTIDAPVDHEIATDAHSQFDEEKMHGGDEKNYNIIKSKDLYNRYNELNTKGLIKPVS